MKINRILTINRILILTLSFLTANMAFADGTCTQIPLNVSGAVSNGGFSYAIYSSFGTPADNMNPGAFKQSILRLFENGVAVGAPHSYHSDIIYIGSGQYSHWSNRDGVGEHLRFSASDNSNPRINGKSYSYCLATTSTQAPIAPTVSITPTVSTGPATTATTTSSGIVPATVGGTISLVTNPTAVFTEPALQRPFYLSPITEPTFGTKVTRIAGNIGAPINFLQGGTDTWTSYARHSYSKNQPWNADQSLVVVDNDNRRIFLDGNTYQPKFREPSGYGRGDDRWHPTLPNIRVSVVGNKLEWYDVVNNYQVRNWTLPFAPDWGIGQGEGNVSSNGRYVAFANSNSMYIVDMDPQAPFASYASGNKRIGPATTISDCGASNCSIDWFSVSPSGKYAVVKYFSLPARVYDVDPNTLALTARPLPVNSPTCSAGDHSRGFLVNMGHADMTMNPFDNNEDVIIGQKQGSTCPAGASSVMMVRLRDNAVTSLTSGNTATMTHISARNLQRPGWVYVTYLDPANYQWDTRGLAYSNEIVAVKMDGSGAVERLAHTHSYNAGIYDAQEHAVPSPDGKRVLWASNWALNGNGSAYDIKPYVADTRQ